MAGLPGLKRARFVNDAPDPEVNNLTVLGDVTVAGDATIDGALILPQQATAPGTVEGTIYMDDGSNTTHGDAGPRYALTSAIYLDIPYYQEGTTVPIISDGGNNFTLTTATSTWTRIGNRVYINGLCIWSSKGAASGPIVIENSSPYNIDTTKVTGAVGSVAYVAITPTAAHIVTIRNTAGANLNFIEYDSAGALGNVTDAQFGAAGTIYWSISYPTTAGPTT